MINLHCTILFLSIQSCFRASERGSQQKTTIDSATPGNESTGPIEALQRYCIRWQSRPPKPNDQDNQRRGSKRGTRYGRCFHRDTKTCCLCSRNMTSILNFTTMTSQLRASRPGTQISWAASLVAMTIAIHEVGRAKAVPLWSRYTSDQARRMIGRRIP